MAKSPDEGLASMIRNLEEKTGRSIESWIATARGSGLAKHKEIVEFLKSEHALTHGYANQIAQRALAASDAPAPGSDDMVEAQYQGPKAAMKPLYLALVAAVRKFGPDVEIAPKKANVSLRRSKQFGLIQPSTSTRVDVGLILKGVPPSGRLQQSGSWNAMFTHRVKVGSLAEVDSQLIGWLRQAYEGA
jgi:Domain of unknown function (DUF4287)/Domain of unknown function (DUF5655)